MPKLSEVTGASSGKLKLSQVTGKPTPPPSGKKVDGRYGITRDLQDLFRAAGHHAMAPLHGVAQYVEHGANAAANLLPDGNPVRKYVNGVVAQDDKALQNRERTYQAKTPDSVPSYVGAAIGGVAPWVAGIGALRSAGVIPQVTSKGGKVATLAAEGAATGLATPVTSGGSYASEKTKQVVVGGLAAPAAVGGMKLAGGVGRVAQHAFRPQSVADANIARMFGNDPAIAAKLRAAPQYVPGEVPSAAQVIQTPEAIQAERVLRNNPASATAFAAQDAANNGRRMDVVRGLAGDDDAIQAAIAARREATQPYRQANLPEEGSPPVDPSPVIATLQKLSLSANATVRAAATEHLGLIKANAGPDGTVPAYVLDDIRQEAGGMLAKHAPQGAVGSKVSAKYDPVTSQIADTLDAAVPGYRNYLAAYADTSIPINTMESVGKLVDPNAPGGLNVTGDPILGAARLKQVLRGDDKARYPMSEDARRQLEGVRESLARRGISDNKVAASGPGTAADLEANGTLAKMIFGNNMGRNGGPLGRAAGLGAGGLIGSLFGPAGAAVGGALGMGITDGIGAVNQRAAARVGETAASAPLTADAIERYFQRNQPTALDYLLYGQRPRQLPPPR